LWRRQTIPFFLSKQLIHQPGRSFPLSSPPFFLFFFSPFSPDPSSYGSKGTIGLLKSGFWLSPFRRILCCWELEPKVRGRQRPSFFPSFPSLLSSSTQKYIYFNNNKLLLLREMESSYPPPFFFLPSLSIRFRDSGGVLDLFFSLSFPPLSRQTQYPCFGGRGPGTSPHEYFNFSPRIDNDRKAGEEAAVVGRLLFFFPPRLLCSLVLHTGRNVPVYELALRPFLSPPTLFRRRNEKSPEQFSPFFLFPPPPLHALRDGEEFWT